MKKIITLAAAALCLLSCSETYDAGTTTTTNPVIESIMARRSIRHYKDVPVSRDTMDIILNCGINAPSGMNLQPWELRVVDSREFIDGVTAVWKESAGEQAEREMRDPGFRNMFRNAPTVVFVAAPEGSGDLDCGLLVENMLLAAQSMGIGSCCLGAPVRFMLDSDGCRGYIERLQIPAGYRLLLAVAFGYPDESPEAKPRSAEKVRYVE